MLTIAAQNAATMQPIFESLSFLIVCPSRLLAECESQQMCLTARGSTRAAGQAAGLSEDLD